MSDTVDTTTDTAAETAAPATPATPATPAAQPVEAPPAGGSPRSGGWFSRSWRCGVAAAVIVLVAGAFFTIGWFTSTQGDCGYALGAERAGKHMGMRDGYWDGRSPSGALPAPQGPAAPQAPSGPRTPAAPQTPVAPEAPSAQQAYLGVGVTTVAPELQQQYGLSRADGALVTSLDRRAPAFQAGIRRGDIITSIDGTPVTTREDVVDLVAKKNPGDSISVVVDRDGQSLTFQVTLSARPAAISG